MPQWDKARAGPGRPANFDHSGPNPQRSGTSAIQALFLQKRKGMRNEIDSGLLNKESHQKPLLRSLQS
jgi:hypothetical protein